jgi:hypothetical protein
MTSLKTNVCSPTYPYDCDTDSTAHASQKHQCVPNPMDCKTASQKGTLKKPPICGETAGLKKHRIDCDYVKKHNTSQRGFCVKEQSHCYDNHMISNHPRGYRTRKAFGSIWLRGKELREANKLRAEANVAEAEAAMDTAMEQHGSNAANKDVEIATKELESAAQELESAAQELESATQEFDAADAEELEGDDALSDIAQEKETVDEDIVPHELDGAMSRQDVPSVPAVVPSVPAVVPAVPADLDIENQNAYDFLQREEQKRLRQLNTKQTIKGQFRRGVHKFVSQKRKAYYTESATADVYNTQFIKEVEAVIQQPPRSKQYTPLIRMLESAMVNINYSTEDHKTALDLANEAAESKLVRYLKRRGAKAYRELGSVETAEFADVPYPAEWLTGFKAGQNELDVKGRYRLTPGQDGFNAYCEGLLVQHVQNADPNFYPTCGSILKEGQDGSEMGDDPLPAGYGVRQRMPFPTQKIFKWLMHPLSPVKRMLAVHMAGAGKTNMIADTLSNYFEDPRPKFIVCPKKEHVTNLYQDLLKIEDHQMVTYLKKNYPAVLHKCKSDTDKIRDEGISEVKDIFELKTGKGNAMYNGKRNADGSYEKTKSGLLKNWEGGLYSPIRAYKLADFVRLVTFASNEDNLMLKWGRASKGAYLLSDKIILIDEVHNFVNPFADFSKAIASNPFQALAKSVTHIQNAENSVVVGFTATPFVQSEKAGELADGDRLFNMIKGNGNKDKNDDGFVSYYMRGMNAMFAVATPEQTSMPEKIEVDLPPTDVPGVGKEYAKRRGGPKPPASLHVMVGSPRKNEVAKEKRKKELFEKTETVAPKMHRAMQLIQEHPADQKILILANEDSGFHAMAQLLGHHSVPYMAIMEAASPELLTQPPEDRRQLGQKGHNAIKGQYVNGKLVKNLTLGDIEGFEKRSVEECRVLMLNTDNFTEGISVKNATLTICLTPLDKWSQFRQAFARGVRSCGHMAFKKPERHARLVQIVMVDPSNKTKTLDQENWDIAENERKDIEGKLCKFARRAIDKNILVPLTGVNSICFPDMTQTATPKTAQSNATKCPRRLSRKQCADWCADEPRLYIEEDLIHCSKDNFERNRVQKIEEEKNPLRASLSKAITHRVAPYLPFYTEAAPPKTQKQNVKDLKRQLHDGKISYKQYKKKFNALYKE